MGFFEAGNSNSTAQMMVVVTVASEGEGITFQWMDAWAQGDDFQKSDELKDLIAKVHAILPNQSQCGKMLFYKTFRNDEDLHMTVLKEQICPN